MYINIRAVGNPGDARRCGEVVRRNSAAYGLNTTGASVC